MINGYIKLPAIDFDTFNNTATVYANTPVSEGGLGKSYVQYTCSTPDTNPAFVWAKVEHAGITDLPVVSYEDAVLQGMKISEN